VVTNISNEYGASNFSPGSVEIDDSCEIFITSEIVAV
jgi:hypothetical protein